MIKSSLTYDIKRIVTKHKNGLYFIVFPQNTILLLFKTQLDFSNYGGNLLSDIDGINKKDFFFIALYAALVYACKAQTSGIILDVETREPVAGVQIYTNTNKIITTNKSGRYSIFVPFTSFTIFETDILSAHSTSLSLKIPSTYCPRA